MENKALLWENRCGGAAVASRPALAALRGQRTRAGGHLFPAGLCCHSLANAGPSNRRELPLQRCAALPSRELASSCQQWGRVLLPGCPAAWKPIRLRFGPIGRGSSKGQSWVRPKKYFQGGGILARCAYLLTPPPAAGQLAGRSQRAATGTREESRSNTACPRSMRPPHHRAPRGCRARPRQSLRI